MNIHTYRGIRSLVIWITSGCNLQCRLCYMDGGENRQDITEEGVKKALYLSNIEGLREVILAGGEPTLRPDLIKKTVILTRKRFGKQIRISLQTNGVDISDNLIDFFMRYQVGIGISIDGHPELNDAMRGETLKVVNILKRFSKASIAVGITTTLSYHNVGHLSKLALWLSQFQSVQSIGLDPVRPTGRASHSDIAGTRETYEGVKKLNQTLVWINSKRQWPIRLREKDRTFQKAGFPYCYAMSGNALVITPDERLWPCSSLVGQEKFSAGTLTKPLFKTLLLDSGCGECSKYSNCSGRCPARHLISRTAAEIDCVIREVL